MAAVVVFRAALAEQAAEVVVEQAVPVAAEVVVEVVVVGAEAEEPGVSQAETFGKLEAARAVAAQATPEPAVL